MTTTEPTPTSSPQELVRFLEDRFACAEASADCARACALRASLLDPEGPERLRLLRRKAILCAEVCDATCRVLAEDTRVDEAGLRVQLEWCRTVCLETAHAFDGRPKRPGPPGAATTAEACRACARTCTDFMATLH
ncbi:ferredoxin [Streptomyces sp. NPDC005811]|uniref:ferredoxin n=1 Tax=Streptomyces sp. NPDC005811 TaxID=3154565 RepID=UPI0033EFB28B